MSSTLADSLQISVPISFQELLDTLEGTCYLVSRDGLLLAYGSRHWNRFALENGAPELTQPGMVLGRPLSAFIAGEEERQAHQAAADSLVRGIQEEVSYLYQCDAPDRRRRMRMWIRPVLREGAVVALLYQSVVLEDTPRPPVGILYRHAEDTSEWPLLGACSYCKNVRFPPGSREGEWLSPEQYYARGGTDRVRLSHSICPTCYESIVAPVLARLRPS
ncbi:MAG: hypothetical protein ACK47B_17300 [Armatimonadota bacterium]